MIRRNARARSRGMLASLALIAGLGAIGCEEPPCDPPLQRIGSQCRVVKMDGDPSSVDDGGPGPNANCNQPEVCNGLDDDCDKLTDEGVELDVFSDADGDGKGTGLAMRGCVAPGLSPTNDDCDDTNPTRAPGLPELCDGVDNSCNDQADEDLLCQPNQPEIACTTLCGTMGKGTCSALCEVPTGPACIPPAEVCNGKDEDCDGAADQHLTSRVAIDSIAQYPPDTLSRGYHHAQMALTPAPEGQANWFYRAAYTWAGDAPPSAIQGFATARPNQLSSDVAARTADVVGFCGAGDEQHAVLVESAYLGGFNAMQPGLWSLRLQAYKASDLTFASELIPIETREQKMVVPLAVSTLRTEAGELHVLFVYTRPNANGDYVWMFRVARLHATGQWGSTSPEVEIAKAPLRGGVRIARLPCRDEFLVGAIEVSPAANIRTLRRVSGTTGAYVGDEMGGLLPWASSLVGLGDGGPRCRQQKVDDVLAAYQETPADGGTTFLLHLAVDRVTGAVTAADKTLPLDVPSWVGTAIENTGGRWFISSWTKTADRLSPALWEHWLVPNGQGALRAVPLLEANNTKSADPGGASAILLSAFSLTGLVRTSDGILAGFANLTAPGSPTSNLDKGLAAIKGSAPGGVAAAGYYRVGCP